MGISDPLILLLYKGKENNQQYVYVYIYICMYVCVDYQKLFVQMAMEGERERETSSIWQGKNRD